MSLLWQQAPRRAKVQVNNVRAKQMAHQKYKKKSCIKQAPKHSQESTL